MDHPIAFPIALDRELAEKRALEVMLAGLLERVGFVTGVDLETEPTGKSFAAAIAVLDSLTSPCDDSPGWYWADPWGSRTGSFDTAEEAHDDVGGEADQLPNGYMVMRIRDGRALAPMYVAPSRKGAN